MDIIVIKNKDGGVALITPNYSKYGPGLRDYSNLGVVKEAESNGLEWFVCDHSEIPDKKQCESRKQLYWEGDKVLVDSNWEKRVMPDHLIKKKQIARLNKQLDDELDKEAPDVIIVSRLQRKIDKLKSVETTIHNNSIEIMNIAVDNLKSSSKDTSKIEQQINEKIKELENA